jgi:hypothetical protein
MTPAARTFLGMLVFAAVGFMATANAAAGTAQGTGDIARPAAPDSATVSRRVIAYYFHTTYRCSSCRKIEAYARTAIETGFAAEIAGGRLEWRVVNVETKGNEHFVKDYQLYTKSVVLSDQRSGREVRWKNLARVWELLGNEGAFVAYVQAETRAYLDETP